MCVLAAGAGADLATVTIQSVAAGHQDAADLVARALPGVRRLRFGVDDLPSCFSDLAEPGTVWDEPSGMVRSRAQIHRIADELGGLGAAVRMTGHGGDNVVQSCPLFLAGLVRRHPLVGLRQVADYRARSRWPLARTVVALADRRSLGTWLDAAVSDLTAPWRPGRPPGGWGLPFRLPPWASPDTVDLVSAALRRAARTAEPLADQRDQHFRVQHALAACRTARLLDQCSGAAGMPATAPFCDDQVVEACLAVCPEETSGPHSYKPLLVAAMDGLLPEAVAASTTRDHAGPQWYEAPAGRRTELMRFAEESRLVELGILDGARWRTALCGPQRSDLPAAAIEHTLAVELWLRAASTSPTTTSRVADRTEERHHAATG
jgi:asparagine synthase (glutamine-hydrolysing)